MRILHSSLFLCLLGLLPASFAAAQNQFDLGDLEPGQVVLNLSVSERLEVDQDTLTASLQYSAQGRDKAALQDEVNQAIAAALEILEEAENVEFSTQQYHVYIFQAGRPTRADVENPLWRAQQGVTLISRDSGELLELAGRLQEAGLHITSLYYTLSPQRYEEVTEGLMNAALEKLQARADQAAGALNKSGAALIEVSIDGGPGYGFREPVMRAMAADAAESMAPPVASPGKTEVMLTVSARALLSP